MKLSRFLSSEKKEYVLSKQLLRSGTSIGANVEEAAAGHSRKDFLAKMEIAHKEARESYYWLRLLKDSEFLSQEQSQSILEESHELIKILSSITKSTREKNS